MPPKNRASLRLSVSFNIQTQNLVGENMVEIKQPENKLLHTHKVLHICMHRLGGEVYRFGVF